VTALSVLLLRERVGWRRWTGGADRLRRRVIALRPSSSSFTLPALIRLSGSVIYALVMITTRALRETNDITLMTTYFSRAGRFRASTVRSAGSPAHARRSCSASPAVGLRQHRGAVLRHPLAQARIRERGRAVSSTR
jgi:hypothetical protein